MNREKKRTESSSTSFLVCLLLAIACWLLVTFSKDYRVTMDYKIRCYNLPEGKESVTVSDTVLSLTFQQKGLQYLSKPYSDKDKVVYISVTDLIKTKNKVSVYTFSNKDMREYLSHNVFGSTLVAVESPEVVTFYLR